MYQLIVTYVDGETKKYKYSTLAKAQRAEKSAKKLWMPIISSLGIHFIG